MEELRRDAQWHYKATKAVADHWRNKNNGKTPQAGYPSGDHDEPEKEQNMNPLPLSNEPPPSQPPTAPASPPPERLAYSIPEAADMLGVNYSSVYRLIQRDKLKACRVLRGKFLIPRTELLKLLAGARRTKVTDHPPQHHDKPEKE